MNIFSSLFPRTEVVSFAVSITVAPPLFFSFFFISLLPLYLWGTCQNHNKKIQNAVDVISFGTSLKTYIIHADPAGCVRSTIFSSSLNEFETKYWNLKPSRDCNGRFPELLAEDHNREIDQIIDSYLVDDEFPSTLHCAHGCRLTDVLMRLE